MGALNKCWKGFKIAKSEFDTNNMFHYAKGIRRLQRELKTSVSQFQRFGLIGRITVAEVEEQNLPGRSYAQTLDEIEKYELQEQGPFRIQFETDLAEEQEEWADPVFYE
ncbi:MAG: hypothetical protein WAK17_19955 [Candidatus Nitrosopolaris sp.]